MAGKYKNKILIIIGGGLEQKKAYQIAKKNGAVIISTDINPQCPCATYADHFIKASTRDYKQTVSKLKQFFLTSKLKPDGVMTIANDVPLTVAHVAKFFGLPGISIEAAKILQRKDLMKELFAENNINTSKWIVTDVASEIKNFMLDKKKIVIKPLDGRGALGVYLLTNEDQIDSLLSKSLAISKENKVIVEEFTEGIQLSSESMILNGKVFTPTIAHRNYSRIKEFLPHIIEDGGDIPAPLNNQILSIIDEIILNISRSLDIDNGIIKGDLILANTGEVFVVEVAGRLSGGLFASHQIPLTTGVDLVEAEINRSIGIEISPSELIPKFNKSSCIRYIFPQRGTIKDIKGLSKIYKIENVEHFEMFKNINDVCYKTKKHGDRLGYVLAVANNNRIAKESCLKALSEIEVIYG
tara:strand:- start:325 stop:1560 length:1236 start_codon:yes stop_codon:yes gene_type:complete